MRELGEALDVLANRATKRHMADTKKQAAIQSFADDFAVSSNKMINELFTKTDQFIGREGNMFGGSGTFLSRTRKDLDDMTQNIIDGFQGNKLDPEIHGREQSFVGMWVDEYNMLADELGMEPLALDLQRNGQSTSQGMGLDVHHDQMGNFEGALAHRAPKLSFLNRLAKKLDEDISNGVGADDEAFSREYIDRLWMYQQGKAREWDNMAIDAELDKDMLAALSDELKDFPIELLSPEQFLDRENWVNHINFWGAPRAATRGNRTDQEVTNTFQLEHKVVVGADKKGAEIDESTKTWSVPLTTKVHPRGQTDDLGMQDPNLPQAYRGSLLSPAQRTKTAYENTTEAIKPIIKQHEDNATASIALREKQVVEEIEQLAIDHERRKLGIQAQGLKEGHGPKDLIVRDRVNADLKITRGKQKAAREGWDSLKGEKLRSDVLKRHNEGRAADDQVKTIVGLDNEIKALNAARDELIDEEYAKHTINGIPLNKNGSWKLEVPGEPDNWDFAFEGGEAVLPVNYGMKQAAKVDPSDTDLNIAAEGVHGRTMMQYPPEGYKAFIADDSWGPDARRMAVFVKDDASAAEIEEAMARLVAYSKITEPKASEIAKSVGQFSRKDNHTGFKASWSGSSGAKGHEPELARAEFSRVKKGHSELNDSSSSRSKAFSKRFKNKAEAESERGIELSLITI